MKKRGFVTANMINTKQSTREQKEKAAFHEDVDVVCYTAMQDWIDKGYNFFDINKLDIELVDYLGNTIDLSGFDWSFTLELKQIVNSSDKTTAERNALVFNNIYRS